MRLLWARLRSFTESVQNAGMTYCLRVGEVLATSLGRLASLCNSSMRSSSMSSVSAAGRVNYKHLTRIRHGPKVVLFNQESKEKKRIGFQSLIACHSNASCGGVFMLVIWRRENDAEVFTIMNNQLGWCVQIARAATDLQEASRCAYLQYGVRCIDSRNSWLVSV